MKTIQKRTAKQVLIRQLLADMPSEKAVGVINEIKKILKKGLVMEIANRHYPKTYTATLLIPKRNGSWSSYEIDSEESRRATLIVSILRDLKLSVKDFIKEASIIYH